MRKSTDITIILDRSGSMDYIKEATIKGFNSFLNEQQMGNNDDKISLVQFDHEYQVVYESININEVKPLNENTFIPRGSTALLDAIGNTVKNTKNRINHLNKSDKPKNVLIVIITDGEENSSNKYTRERIFKKISNREKRDDWKFVFIGSNQDAISVGENIGISRDRSLTFKNDNEGTEHAFKSMSREILHSSLDAEYNMAFIKEDREIQERDN